LQVWFMLSITGGVALAWMLRSCGRWHGGLRTLWQTGLAVLFSIALAYPVLGTQARFLDRFNKDDTPLTLDGMEYMKYAVHGEFGLYFRLEGDYDIIRWLQQNVDGTPVIAEAHVYPSEYHWGGRISIYTGFPTLFGWRFHQIQQHTLPDMDMMIQSRENNVAAFYGMEGTSGIDTAETMIRAFDVEYVVVGALERAFYGDVVVDAESGLQTAGHSAGLAKFDTMADMGLLEVVYSHDWCLDSAIEDAADCAPEQVYTDKIYHVIAGTAQSAPRAAGS